MTIARDGDDPLVVVMMYLAAVLHDRSRTVFVITTPAMLALCPAKVSEISRAYVRCSRYRMWYRIKTVH